MAANAYDAARLAEYLDEREHAELLAASDPSTGWPPIVLVHGCEASAQHWDGAVPLLVRSGYRVFALDMRGLRAPLLAVRAGGFVRDVVRAPAFGTGNGVRTLAWYCTMRRVS